MTKKIKKILIANRGEIACRVMETCREMGIASVAVYSDADRKALHVRTADEAVHIGASPAAESYLVIDKIIAACKSSGADAVHPGYGFLSENPTFARRLQKEGITFIGPSPESMEAMGLKDAAKKLMEKAGVPVTPGYHGKDQDPQLLKAKAGMIGYPVLIKAIAGGGGKGMRKVDAEVDFEDALASCQREAKSSFGDDRVLIEKYILSPRHIEVQVFGDTHGNVVHMFERDCSLQRRHQKVIEEAPAPGMTEKVRKAMTDAAIEAAKTVNYVGAGTVEFIVDGSGSLRPDGFWFMEMNTRLQVEHPVTEMITGLDLVELQIRIAQGEKLPKQKEITMQGHAVEARIYAEDPSNDFLPSIGYVDHILWPWDAERIDTCLESTNNPNIAAQRVSSFYDPMIAKIISHSKSRNAAIYGLLKNLDDTSIYPLKTNASYLFEVLQRPEFISGKVSTYVLPAIHANVLDTLAKRQKLLNWQAIIEMVVRDSSVHANLHFDNNFNVHDHAYAYAWRSNLKTGYSRSILCNDELYNVHVEQATNGWQYTINGEKLPEGFSQYETDNLLVDFFNKHVVPEHVEGGYSTSGGGWHNGVFTFSRCGNTVGITPVINSSENTSNSNIITAPMPGKIIAVNASVGDVVKAGDKLIIMEAMKMEMSLEAPRDGVVASVSGISGALVADGEVLLALEENT